MEYLKDLRTPQPGESSEENLPEPARAPVRSSVRFTHKEPAGEARAATPQPPDAKRDVRSMLCAIPVVVDTETLREAPLDNRAGFLLWLIDGVIPVETILDLSGMSAEETLALLDDLLERGIVKLRWSAFGARAPGAIDPSEGSWKPLDPIAEMREHLAAGDYESALVVADLALAREPGKRDVRAFRADCCRDLEDVYAFRLRPFDRVPMLVGPREQTEALGIDTGVVVSLIDGSATLESIVESCFMPRFDVLRILHDLVERGIVAFLADTPGNRVVRDLK